MLSASTALTVPTWVIQGFILFAMGLIVTFMVKTVAKQLQNWMRGEFQTLMNQVKPNGGTTMSNGDVTKRTEEKLDAHAVEDLRVQKEARKETKALRKEVRALASEVRTANGLTIGELADNDEARRISTEVPKAERTETEQGYVDRLEAKDRKRKSA